MLRVKIMSMTRWHLHEVLETEIQNLDEWDENHFVRCLQEPDNFGKVVFVEGLIVAFVVFKHVNHQIRILNMSVRFARQGTGIGSEIINYLKQSNPTSSICAVLRNSDTELQFWFYCRGFRHVRTHVDPFDDDRTYAMEYRSDVSRQANIDAGYQSLAKQLGVE